jgi:phosphinothricin acetyltransferase
MKTPDSLDIRPLAESDYPSVKAIYEEGIATGHATFETLAPEWEEWDRKFLHPCRLVAVSQGSVVGWAALGSVSDRCVYGGVGEVAVYVAEEARGQGVGTRLLSALAGASEEAGFWTLQAGVFPENRGSVRVLEKCGFRVVGTRERLGRMGGRWRDVLLLERRSPRVGVD